MKRKPNHHNQSNRRRRPKNVRRRNAAKHGALAAMLVLLLIVCTSAIAFVVILYMNDLLPTALGIETPAFAGSGVMEALPAWAEDLIEDVPGWLGQPPEGAPEVGSDVLNIPGGPLSPLSIYAAFPFYIPENSQYYEEFQRQNPNMDAQTVVWKVNAFLHIPFYSYIRVNTDPAPLLVNPSHRLPYGFTPAVLVPVYDGNPDLLATPETAEAFARMRASAIRAELDLAVVSAYRPATRQRYLFDRQGGRDGVVARPYHSEHQTGRALDLWGPTPSGLLDSVGPPTPTGIWVSENAHYYGFIVRYTADNSHITGFIPEPWHITYVTEAISRYIHRNGLSSLEEFVARNPGVGM